MMRTLDEIQAGADAAREIMNRFPVGGVSTRLVMDDLAELWDTMVIDTNALVADNRRLQAQLDFVNNQSPAERFPDILELHKGVVAQLCAANKTNADLQARLDKFEAAREVAEAARNNYQDQAVRHGLTANEGYEITRKGLADTIYAMPPPLDTKGGK